MIDLKEYFQEDNMICCVNGCDELTNWRPSFYFFPKLEGKSNITFLSPLEMHPQHIDLCSKHTALFTRENIIDDERFTNVFVQMCESVAGLKPDYETLQISFERIATE